MKWLEISILCPTKIKENTEKSVFFVFLITPRKFTCKGVGRKQNRYEVSCSLIFGLFQEVEAHQAKRR